MFVLLIIAYGIFISYLIHYTYMIFLSLNIRVDVPFLTILLDTLSMATKNVHLSKTKIFIKDDSIYELIAIMQ